MTNDKKPSPFIRPGLYPLLRVVACKRRDPKSPARYRLYIVEFKIMESEVEEHGPGASVVWVMRGGPSLMEFLACALEIHFNAVDHSTADIAFGPENPLRGLLLRCEARELKSRREIPFTYCKWTLLDSEAPA